MIKDTKKIIITILIIVSMFTIFFVSRITINKKEDKLPEVRLNDLSDKNNDNMFAIMVSDNNEEKYKGGQVVNMPIINQNALIIMVKK